MTDNNKNVYVGTKDAYYTPNNIDYVTFKENEVIEGDVIILLNSHNKLNELIQKGYLKLKKPLTIPKDNTEDTVPKDKKLTLNKK